MEYHGVSGSTADCVLAVERLLQHGPRANNCVILSHDENTVSHHALMITTYNGDQIFIRSGFTSGYDGEGPRGFAKVLSLLDWHGVQLSEISVSSLVIESVDKATLSDADLKTIYTSKTLKPTRLWDYVYAVNQQRLGSNPWKDSPSFLPLQIFDDRLATAARDFEQDPDGFLLKGNRLLECSVRDKAGITDSKVSGAVAVFTMAFNGRDPLLIWEGISPAEKEGRSNLFIGFAKSYRNPRAHKSENGTFLEQVQELLLLNHLLCLEAKATLNLSKSAKRLA